MWRAVRKNNDGDRHGKGDLNEAYQYDGLHRLTKAQRGRLNKGTPTAPIGGDTDIDGIITSADYDDIDTAWLQWHYNGKVPDGGFRWEVGDFNIDGTLNSNDYDIIDTNNIQESSINRSVTHTWEWDLDELGNWTGYQYDAGAGGQGNWDLEQARSHNDANEIDNDNDHSNSRSAGTITETVGSSWITPGYDAAGNMVYTPRPGDEADDSEALHLVYDAWNRVVEVWEDTDGDGTLDDEPDDTQILECRYDGLGRRIAKIDKTGESDVTYDYYYNTSWQVLEVRKDGDPHPLDQYVWDIRYIDAPLLRWRDGNTDGDLDGGTEEGDNTLYYTNDANMNVTALVDESDGAVVERYMYDPYGKVSVRHGVRDSGGTDTSESEWDERTSDTFENEILYCGYRWDGESGLYHVRHRMYHPTLGRFLQRDPGGYADGMSLYEYVGSNPIRRNDPAGLSWLKDLWNWLFGTACECARVKEEYLDERWLYAIVPDQTQWTGASGTGNEELIRPMSVWTKPYATLWICCIDDTTCEYRWGAVDYKYATGVGASTTNAYPATKFVGYVVWVAPERSKRMGLRFEGIPPTKPFKDPDGNPPPEGCEEIAELTCKPSGKIPPAPEAPPREDPKYPGIGHAKPNPLLPIPTK